MLSSSLSVVAIFVSFGNVVSRLAHSVIVVFLIFVIVAVVIVTVVVVNNLFVFVD